MIQLIGNKKCKNTGKAKRFFSERGIPFQDLDLKTHKLSPGELDNITRWIPPEELIDEECSYYKKNGYKWRDYNPMEELLEHPELLKTPVVRSKKGAFCGDQPEGWKELAEKEKSIS
jgi:arsenate reductase (glutaredoxin)